MSDRQSVLFDLEVEHRLFVLPRIAGRSRATCRCGADFAGATSDAVANQHNRHVEAQR